MTNRTHFVSFAAVTATLLACVPKAAVLEDTVEQSTTGEQGGLDRGGSSSASNGDATAESEESGSTPEEDCTSEERSEEVENTYPLATTCDLPLWPEDIGGRGVFLDGEYGSSGNAFSLSEDCTVSGVFPSTLDKLLDGYTGIALTCMSGGQPKERVIDAPISQSIEVYAAPGSTVHLERVVEGPAGSPLSNGWIGLYDASDELIVGGAALGIPDSFNAPAGCAEGDPSCAFFRPLTIGGPEDICPPERPHVCFRSCFDTQRVGLSVAIGDTVAVVGDQVVSSITNGAGYDYDIMVAMAVTHPNLDCSGSPATYRYVISRVPPDGR